MNRLLTATLAAVALVSLASPAHARAPIAPDFRVFTANVGSGAECATDCLATVDAQMAAWSPDAVALQEVCASDRDAFEAAHPGWQVAWHTMIAAFPGCGGGDKGEMVAAPALERTLVVDLPGDTDAPGASNDGPVHREYGAVCGDTGAVWVCSTHLTPPGLGPASVREAQVQYLAFATTLLSKVAVCGDFNMQPHADAFGAFPAAGYTETDRADDQPTEGGPPRVKKFDDVWWHKGSGAAPAAVSGLVVSQPASHHDLLRGSVEW